MLLLCLTKKSSDFPICFDSSYNLSVACVSSLRWMDNFSGERIALRSKTRIWIRSHNSLSHIHGRCEKSIQSCLIVQGMNRIVVPVTRQHPHYYRLIIK